MCDAWVSLGFKNVINDSFDHFMDTHDVEAIVSPANSYGVMTGGYDRAISEYFGWDLTKRVQAYIKDTYNGPQPVATSIIFDIDGKHKLIHTPTMLKPSRIQDPDIVRLCTKSTLDCARENNIGSIVMPAFGGACGGLSFEVIAEQMKYCF